MLNIIIVFVGDIKTQLRNILYVSKITNVSNKKARVVLSVVLSNASVAADILVIVIFSSIISNQVNTSNFVVDYFMENKYLLPFLVILRFLFLYIEKMNLQSLQLSVRENLRVHLLDEVYKKGNYSLSDATFYVNELTNHISYFYSALTMVISASVQFLFYGSFLIYSSFEVISIFLFGGIVLFFPSRYLLRLGRKYIHISYNNSLKISKDIQRVVDNIFLIKILRTSKKEMTNFKDITKKYSTAQLNNFKFGTINSILPNFLVILVFSIIIVFFDLLEFLTLEFIGVTLRLVQTLSNFNSSLNALVNSHVHLEKLNEIKDNNVIKNPLEIKPEILDKDQAIIFENVEFQYFGAESAIFNNLNFQVEKNKHTIITGTNGSGKSTLIGLLSGALEPSKGKVVSHSEQIGYIGAKPLIIPGTLRDNVLYGNRYTIEDSKINQYLNKFNLDDISINSQISNLSLSSGQMQKISFIRALLNNVEILFLDESTSNLDEESKEQITEILNSLNITIVNSTHNPDDFNYDKQVKLRKFKNETSLIY